jgi:hypothetical protein
LTALSGVLFIFTGILAILIFADALWQLNTYNERT